MVSCSGGCCFSWRIFSHWQRKPTVALHRTAKTHTQRAYNRRQERENHSQMHMWRVLCVETTMHIQPHTHAALFGKCMCKRSNARGVALERNKRGKVPGHQWHRRRRILPPKAIFHAPLFVWSRKGGEIIPYVCEMRSGVVCFICVAWKPIKLKARNWDAQLTSRRRVYCGGEIKLWYQKTLPDWIATAAAGGFNGAVDETAPPDTRDGRIVE